MRSNVDWRRHALFQGLGSLWLAVVLLVIILVAMACATVFESLRGAEHALAMFYQSWWFVVLLVLLAINVCMAVITRLRRSRKQIGFVVTHGSILLILTGALVTKRFGVDGQVSILEGENVEHLTIARDTLILVRRSDGTEATVELGSLPAAGLRPAERPAVAELTLDDVRVEVARYVPDGVESREVVNDSPNASLAVEVSFSRSSGRGQESAWVFADQTVQLGSMSVLFREVDEDELRRLLEETPEAPPKQTASLGSVRVDHQGATFEFPVEKCMQSAVAVGDTGFTLRVVRYLPHALVGDDNQLRNASNRPVNPTIEVELAGPEGTVVWPAFANFPEFWSTHGPKGTAGLKVTLLASSAIAASAPVSVLSGPEGKLYARFAREGRPAVAKELTIGKPCESPWAGRRLTVLRQFDHARIKRTVAPLERVRKERVPAVLLDVKSPSGTQSVWLQKYQPHAVLANGSTYDLVYGNRRVPLGFSVTLKEFQIGYYPGTRRPRSFESLITILDPASARKLNRVISMNRPTKFGGYTFYQSSYHQQGGQMVSVLSVSWDPGQPIVFAGYLGALAGMLLVLGQRILSTRDSADRRPEARTTEGKRSKSSESST